MGLIVSIVVGGIVGWLASLIMKTSAQMGIFANVVAGLIGLAVYGTVARGIVAVAGAAILIWILKALGIFK